MSTQALSPTNGARFTFPLSLSLPYAMREVSKEFTPPLLSSIMRHRSLEVHSSLTKPPPAMHESQILQMITKHSVMSKRCRPIIHPNQDHRLKSKSDASMSYMPIMPCIPLFAYAYTSIVSKLLPICKQITYHGLDVRMRHSIKLVEL